MRVAFMSQDKADQMLKVSVESLYSVVSALNVAVDGDDEELFDHLAEAARQLIEQVGYARHLFGGPNRLTEQESE